ncbi:ABC transporter ATP-binding protein [Microbacterium sp. CJ88]|uniref:ABC transporter ATP-binding protein n=1 Tax=Microbacterium sp. CJ88 TaxID=3445672 RepID=UPI003F65BDBB
MYQLENVTKVYRGPRGPVTALDDVSLTVEDGEWVAVTGPTGGGKSTLLQLLGALDRPASGTVRFGSGDTTAQLDRLPERALTSLRARRIGFVFQSFNLIPTLSALDNVVAALRPLGVGGGAARERAAAALDAVGLGDRADHVPGMLSGGQQQRVAVARALVKDPDVLLADEPTGNLDERMRDEIVSLFASVWADRGVTVVMVTHDSRLARRAGRTVHLADGRLRPGA